MRKQLIPLIITLLSLIGNNTFAQWANGDGSAGNPWQISTKADLNTIANNVNNGTTTYSGVYFKMTANISMSVSGTFNPIGTTRNRSFRGNFNGQGYIISNFNPSAGIAYLGIFGYIRNATIENIGIGGGCNINSANNGYTGGLIGYAETSTINNCYSSASMSGNTNCRLGGLIGNANDCDINNCYYSGGNINYSGSNGYYGGLIGYIEGTTNISNSYSAPSNFPNQSSRTGPLYGRCITNCFTNSYYLSGWNTQTYGTSKTAIQMQDQQFAILLNVSCQNNNWKHDNIPTLVNGGFPILYWQVGGSTLPACFDEGDGTEDDPFRIRYVKDLVMLSTLVSSGTSFSNTYFRVENNISFVNGANDSSSYFLPIGNRNYAFQGNFDGNGKVISNLTKDTNIQDVGLFGKVENNATIKNLGIEGANITLRSVTGSLNYHAAGLVAHIGDNSSGFCTISGCYVSSSTIKGYGTKSTIAGLIGYAGRTKIENCYARANIIQGDYSSQNNNNENFYGGLVGYINLSTSISNSYSSPLSFTSRTTAKGLLVGVYDVSNSFPNSYYDNTISVNGYNGIGTSKDSTEMKSGCFVVSLNGTQPSIVWFKAKRQVNQGYPILSWQKLSDGITPAGFEGNCLSVAWNEGAPVAKAYQVRYVKDLIFISNMVANDTAYANKFFVLQNDISFNDCTNDYSSLFSPIGISGKPFSGNFNGRRDASNRYAIANYKFSNANSDNIGLFGYISGATIQNLGISNFNITAKDNVGGLVGASTGTNTINDCFVYGHIKGVNNVGGLVGNETATGTTINRSFTNVTIDAKTNVGGIVGLHSGSITNAYSNSEIYSSTTTNSLVGGIVGLANTGSTLTNVYSAAKIVRNGTNTTFGKIRGSNLTTGVLNCYSRDSVFVNYTNINPTGYGGTTRTNSELRISTFATSTLGSTNWKADFTNNINDGYPILTYQVAALTATNGAWQNPTTASQIVIIPSGVQVKTSNTNCPKSAYVKIETGGELNNQTNLSLFGEYNRELSVGKWNLIGLATNNQNLASLINFTAKPITNYAATPYKTIVKRFDPATNNWATVTTQDINTQFNYGEGILVMPNYSLDANYLQSKSRIVSKGILFNESPLSRPFTNTAVARFVSLANNYPISLNVNATSTPIAGNTAAIQGGLVYVYDADSGKWNNNLNTSVRVTKIKPSEGFFIAAVDAIGNFIFDKSINPSNAKSTYKSNLIYVNATANNETREAFLQMNEDAENGFDFNDGLMMFGSNGNAVEPFFRINAGKEAFDSEIGELDILKDAFSTLPYTTELDLRSEKENDVSLRFSNLPSDIHVYLLDSLLKNAQYLNENADYSLKTSAGDNKNRLFVLFSYYKEDINQFFKPEMAEEIRIWNYENILHIDGKDLIRYEIYDILGNRLVEEETLEDDYQKALSLKNGIYIVRAYSKTSSKAEKISINN